MSNPTTTNIGSGEVLIDELIQSLVNFRDEAQQQISNFTSSDNDEFKQLISSASESISKRTAERVVLRNSVKRDIARRLAEELVFNNTFMDELGRQIIQINSQQNAQSASSS